MTDDDLDRLTMALRTATPVPDERAKAAALALAQESFASRQGSAAPARPSHASPKEGGFMTGVKRMISSLNTRPVIAAASGAVAVGLAVMVVLPQLPADLLGRSATVDSAGGDIFDIGGATGESRSRDMIASRQPPGVPISVPTSEPAPQAGSGAEAVRTLDVRPDGTIVADTANDAQAMEPAAAPSGRVVASFPNAAPAPQASQSTGERFALTKLAETSAPTAPKPPVAGAPADTLGIAPPAEEPGDRFAAAETNPLKVTQEEPVSTFSIDVDTASYAFVRAALMGGVLPPSEAVRLEEMINYFPYDYAGPQPGEGPFAASVSVFDTPWNPDTDLVRIAIQGEKPAVADRPPLDLVFLIDTSGSMQDANKLPLLKQSFRLLLAKLSPDDRVAIVTYAGSSGVVLEPTAASDRSEILAALDRLEAGGSTAGEAGLRQAYAIAEDMGRDGARDTDEDHVGRILLATDGDFNVGISDPAALTDFVAAKRESGVYLSVLGFGRGNYHDALMQALAQNGNGTAAYIDTLAEAQKVLADQVSGALFPIADDVKIQVEFNPAVVAEYRLVGYETRMLAREDFNNDRVDAGEIGAGHAVTALYEITPVGSPAIRNEPLRYAQDDTADTGAAPSSEIGFLKLRYKEPDEDRSTLMSTPIVQTGTPDDDARFAASIAWFGQMIGDDRFLADRTWDDVIALANGSKGEDAFGYRAEAVTLMRLAQTLSN